MTAEEMAMSAMGAHLGLAVKAMVRAILMSDFAPDGVKEMMGYVKKSKTLVEYACESLSKEVFLRTESSKGGNSNGE